jgi:hypothetical protein
MKQPREHTAITPVIANPAYYKKSFPLDSKFTPQHIISSLTRILHQQFPWDSVFFDCDLI